ncbi:MAG: hypothetical protein Marn2KO_33970 [Marinobacter nauticus]
MSKNGTEESDSYGMSVTVSGLIAGFSFTAMIAVIALKISSVSANIAFFSFLFATFCFLISTIGGWAILEWLAEIKTDDFRKSTFHNGSIWGLIFGLLAFFVGVVATAFLYSTMAGIIAIVLSCYVVFFFFKTARDVSIAKKGDGN